MATTRAPRRLPPNTLANRGELAEMMTAMMVAMMAMEPGGGESMI